MSAGLVVQKAIRARLVATSAVTTLVPAAAILDRNSRPAPSPSIVLGEDQILPGDDIARAQQEVMTTIHVWKQELSLAGVKTIAGAIRTAIHSARLVLDTGWECIDCYVSDQRFLRDPDGETSHGVVSVTTIVREV
jgi:hypothetical protein